MSNPDFRAPCAELINHLQVRVSNEDRLISTVGYYSQSQQLLDRTRAALAQPEPVGPTESDVTELFYRHMGQGSQVGFENAVAEALARWGTPATQPASMWRLAVRNGELIFQAGSIWVNGEGAGIEWADMPIVDLDEQEVQP
jgi:hypothetical protein